MYNYFIIVLNTRIDETLLKTYILVIPLLFIVILSCKREIPTTNF